MTMSKSIPPFVLIPKHVRAARALLAWSQNELAKAAGIATSTVADFERGQRTPVPNNAQAIRTALEAEGISFLPTGAVIGPPIPTIAPPDRPGLPVRWVSAQDLSDWSDRTDGAVSLPTLIANLIRATHGAARIRFPSDEGVRYSGYDGLSFAPAGSAYVPKGHAGWEIGAQRSKVRQKASEDYQKRSAKPAPLEPSEATYIFVTPRHWPRKDEWATDRQSAGPWREVRVYDADDLVHWIEQNPAVGLWLATRLGKRPSGVRELEDLWIEWSQATEWPLTEDLVLSDRDEDVVTVLRWLRGEPSVLSLRATSTDEIAAFFHATLGELPDDWARAYRARCLIATTSEAAKQLGNAPASLIILLTEPNPGLARTLARQGHFVLQAYDERPVSDGDARTLARPSRDGISTALIAAGISEMRAEGFARDSGRNLAVLRRRLPGAPGRRPTWADGQPPRGLLAALLIGGWDEDSEPDRTLLERIALQPYETIIGELTPLLVSFDSPLQKIGSTWRVTSPVDAWLLLGHNLTNADISRYESEALVVLGSSDPRFEMKPDERWLAGMRGVQPRNSGLLRHGIGQVLILMALYGKTVHTIPDISRRVSNIVSQLLRAADGQRWWSLSSDFRLLAEASPQAFLDALEGSLDQDSPPIEVLFGRDDDGLLGQEHLSDLMWALESLAWSPELMRRVSNVLARLDAIDVKPRRMVNGPANSLRNIHLLWLPQTHAMLEERLSALDQIRRREPGPAWKLMIGILPQGRAHMSPSPVPRWRDYSVDAEEVVTWALVERGTTEVSKRLVEDVGLSSERWTSLLECLGDLVPGPGAAVEKLAAQESNIVDTIERKAIWEKLRSLLHRHRQFPDAEWSLPETILNVLDELYERFSPTDPIEAVAWLFDQNVELPTSTSAGWETEQRDIEVARRQAAIKLYKEGGVGALLALARYVDAGGYIGKALYDEELPAVDIDSVLEASLRSDDQKERDVGHGIIVTTYRDRKQEWAEALIDKVIAEAWGDHALLTLLRALPAERWLWEKVSRIGGEIETTYWQTASVAWLGDEHDDVAHAIRKLIDVGYARKALALAGRSRKIGLPSELLVETLREAATQPLSADASHNEIAMVRHHVAELLQLLDDRNDVDNDLLATLEWTYLDVLEHSRRRPSALLKALSEQPKLFVDLLRAAFQRSETTDEDEPEAENPEIAEAVARRAYKLLDLWIRLPGTLDDGTIDFKMLEKWIEKARSLARDVGREEVADHQIGKMLSASPMGADGNWPAEAVREAIDTVRNSAMIDAFVFGKMNRRGMTTRMPRDGGALERKEAANYHRWSEAISMDHPRTAKALDRLTEYYERDAKREDEQAERLDWRG
ncbi:XRE family transcriptional regulator (plasmid) [Rhizobium leguminosarum bv. viciae]|nr:XRE family transcriptional regulator [Rhizobium leguminosarum bv. viciae]